MPDTLIVPPPGILGVWCDTRALENYPGELRQRRGPAPRAAVACQQVLLAWHAQGSLLDASTLTSLRAARKQILAFSKAAEVLGARRSRAAGRLGKVEDANVPRAPGDHGRRPARPKDAGLPREGIEHPLPADGGPERVLESGADGNGVKEPRVAPHDGGVVRLPENGHGSVADSQGAPPTVEPPVPQDEFMAALAAVFG